MVCSTRIQALAVRSIRGACTAAALTAMAVVASLGADQSNTTARLSPLEPSSQIITSDELFQKLLEHNRNRDLRLEQYSAVRTYQVTNTRGKVYAREVVRVEYQAPDRKNFVVDSEEGSGMVRELVLKRLIDSESETSSGRAHRDSSIEPENYHFNLLGEQDVGGSHCLVVEAVPRRKDKYLFVGKIWIDARDYAIVRIAGQPAARLSFWITRADFVRQYQQIGEFWLPERDETLVHVRLNGNKALIIDHRNYTINSAADTGALRLPGASEGEGQK
jgi:outer membrane lipoprotein-sorting protein